MKYLLTVLIISMLCNYSNAQIGTPVKSTPSIVVGKIAPLGTFIAELSYRQNEVDEKDTTYTLRFRNQKYTRIDSYESVEFSGIGNAVEDLYKAFKSVFTEENKSNKEYSITFTMGKDVVMISNYKVMGITSALFLVKGAHVSLTEKQVDKLFGKN